MCDAMMCDVWMWMCGCGCVDVDVDVHVRDNVNRATPRVDTLLASGRQKEEPVMDLPSADPDEADALAELGAARSAARERRKREKRRKGTTVPGGDDRLSRRLSDSRCAIAFFFPCPQSWSRCCATSTAPTLPRN